MREIHHQTRSTDRREWGSRPWLGHASSVLEFHVWIHSHWTVCLAQYLMHISVSFFSVSFCFFFSLFLCFCARRILWFLVWLGNMSIDIEIASGRGHFQFHSIHVFCNLYLTTQSTCFLQAKGHIQHVLFVFTRFG